MKYSLLTLAFISSTLFAQANTSIQFEGRGYLGEVENIYGRITESKSSELPCRIERVAPKNDYQLSFQVNGRWITYSYLNAPSTQRQVSIPGKEIADLDLCQGAPGPYKPEKYHYWDYGRNEGTLRVGLRYSCQKNMTGKPNGSSLYGVCKYNL